MAVPQLEIKISELDQKCKEVSKISGAYVLIQKLKEKLKSFDQAFELMNQNKTDR